MLKLTRGQIIEQGLNLAARPDLISDARLWLNLFLEDQYYNEDYQWLIKSVDSLAVVHGGTLPLDYRSSASATINRENVARSNDMEIVQDPQEWDSISRSLDNTTGVPEYIYVDQLERKMYFAPMPSPGHTFNLRYYHFPDLPDHIDPTNDDLVPLWGMPVSILIDYIKSRAMEYNDDQRQDGSKTEVKAKVTESKMNNHDRRAGRHTLRMGRSFNKRFPRRGGSNRSRFGD